MRPSMPSTTLSIERLTGAVKILFRTARVIVQPELEKNLVHAGALVGTRWSENQPLNLIHV